MNSFNLALNKISTALIVLTGFLFPVLIISGATDPFVLPKQALVFTVVLLMLVVAGLNLISGGEIRLRRTPFDLPLLGFALVLIISSFLSVGPVDSLISSVTLFSLILLYYILINSFKSPGETSFFTLALFSGSALAGVVILLSFVKVYPLSFLFHSSQLAAVQNQAFNTLGPLLTAAIFFLLLLPLGFGLARENFKENKTQAGIFLFSSIIISVAFLLSVYELFTPPAGGQKPILLPYEYGLQAATSAIGQNFQTLLFGSGPGTFLTDFTRFKNVSFNNLPIWNNIFFSSSSLFLELLATIGLVGVTFFLFILFSVFRTFAAKTTGDRTHLGLFISLTLFALLSFLLPLGFIPFFLFFTLLALYTVSLSKIAPKTVFETKVLVVNLQEGLGVPTNILSLLFIATSFLVVGAGAYFGGRFMLADVTFQKSLIAAAENKGLETYNFQRDAINAFPSRDGFRRVFSQTNLILANNLAQNIRSQNASPSAQQQQDILTLTQQAITNARVATNLSPNNFLNWDNLAGIYRNLIGFGQEAENFAVSSQQQAVLLNPTNPQLRLSLGGIFYQLGRWEDAQRHFEVAVQLKPDFANSYYNLGHALENKGDLEGALLQYQTVEVLIAREAKDSENHQSILAEIEALKERISKEGSRVAAVPPPTPGVGGAPQPVTSQGRQEPLQVSTPSSTLPAQKEKVEIPPPTEATESAR